MAMTTSRQRILVYLEKHRAVTAQEMARDLGMTAANARHHLTRLQEDGLVRVISRRTRGRRGRPVQVYALHEVQRGHNLDGLALALIRLLEKTYPDREGLLAAAAAALTADGADGFPSSLTPRLNAAVDWLNARHYHARWEAHAEGPHVIFDHCPYRTLLDDCPSLCSLDAQILSVLLERSVEQVARLEAGSDGAPACIFLVNLQRRESRA